MGTALRPWRSGGVVARGVSRSFRGVKVLRDVTLVAEAGSIAMIVGPNGCGKTTLLRIIGGVLDPDDGEVRVAGDRPGTGSAAYVPAGDRALYWRLSARHNLEFFARVAGVRGGAAAEEATLAAGALDAARLLPKRVGECSTGQRRRIMIARGLVGRPPVLMLDEPFADLDDAGCRAVADAARAWSDAGGLVLCASPAVDGGPRPDVALRLEDGVIRSGS